MARNEGKIEWLRAVYEAKETLFGAFSDKLTKPDKVNAWKAMHSKAQALALVPNNKDYTYTRDTFWQNLRKNAMKKRDNSRATGTGTTKFTKVDEMVYDIIGKESPTLIGLPVPESGDISTEAAPNPSTQDEGVSSKPQSRQKTGSFSGRRTKMSSNKMFDLKLKRMSLMITLLQKEIYLKDLKIKQLERTLDVPHNEGSAQNVVEVVDRTDNEENFEVDYLDVDDSDV